MSRNKKFNKEVVEDLAKILNDAGLSEIEVKEGDLRIRVAKLSSGRFKGGYVGDSSGRVVDVLREDVISQDGVEGSSNGRVVETSDRVGNGATSAQTTVTSPMVGTAYRAPEPGSTPFVEVGSKVKKGQTLVIIEAMKVMNTIPAPVDGVVTKIHIEDGHPVEFGELLMVIE